MSDKKEVPILDHDYDGIKEYDNPLPTWWLVTFLMTIIFGFHYWIHYEFGGGQTVLQELGQDLAKLESMQKSAPDVGDSEADLNKLVGAAAVLASGESVYQAKCAVCHGQALEGTIGPNLVDSYWIHGKGGLAGVAKVIREGVLDKGMPAWGSLLKSDEVGALTVFIASRKGTTPANPKGPQGIKVEN